MSTVVEKAIETENLSEHAGMFERMSAHQYEQVILCHEPYTNLKAIICVHNTTLGPGLGGIRMWPYETEQAAITDAMRLARAMTFKAAVAGLNLGGAKAVVIGDPAKDKSEAMLRALGRFIDTLSGRYIAAEDVGTATEDMEYIGMETPYVVGVDVSHGGSGDPSPMTAVGVYQGIRASAEQVYGSPKLNGLRVVVQGCGHVGENLIRLLAKAGAELTITDINTDRAEALANEVGAKVCGPDEVFDIDCDIYTPCALGGVINPDTIEKLSCKIVAGAANNQLLNDAMGDQLHDRGIIYAPDFVINAGGLINVAEELGGYNYERARKRVERIYDNVHNILDLAKAQNITPQRAADAVALERIQKIRPITDVYTGRARTAWQHRAPGL